MGRRQVQAGAQQRHITLGVHTQSAPQTLLSTAAAPLPQSEVSRRDRAHRCRTHRPC
jgi:hypothetical protein